MLAKTLLQRGHTVELWTSAFDHVAHQHYHKYSKLEELNEHISVQFLKGCGYPNDLSPKRFIHNRQTGTEFFRLAGRRSKLPDIIFAPVPILELAESAVTFAIDHKLPIVVDVRDLWPDVYLTKIPKSFHKLAKILLHSEYSRAAYIFRKATGISAVSKAYLFKGLSYACRGIRDTDGFFPLGSVDNMSHNSSDLEKRDNKIMQEKGIDHKKFIVTYVGTFSKFCDIQNILDAAKLLKDEKEILIVIIGQGEGSREFFKTAEQMPNVIMTGWLNSSGIREILSNTKVGLVAYSKDAIMSLPNKPFEYMAAGLPLLSSLPGELEELIQEYGIGRRYEAGNPFSLAGEIRWFYNHPEETNHMGEKSRALFGERFRDDIVYEKLSQHLERIVDSYEK